MSSIINEQDIIDLIQPHCTSTPAARVAVKAVIAAYEKGSSIEELAERYKLFPNTIKGMVGA